MSNIIHKVKDALKSDSHHDTTHGTTGTHGHSSATSHSTNHGPHDSNLANKADPRVDSDLDGRSGTGKYSSSTNAGPHDSNLANKLDPRVDSDRDGSHTAGAGGLPTGTHGHSTTHGSGLTGTHGASHTSGPHNSNLLNQADPRVDSDRDGSRNFGAATGQTGASAYGSTTGHNSSLTSGSTNHGPHDSNLLNKIDPRVDSDRDGSRNLGAATGQTGASAYSSTTGTHGTGLTGSHGTHGSGLTGTHGSSLTSGSTNHGPHDSNLANKVDPRVDSDRDGSRNFGAATGHTGASAYNTTGTHGTTHGSGLTGSHNAPNTAGPHNSDLLNKIDPRVDSDRDGSKTLGQQKY